MLTKKLYFVVQHCLLVLTLTLGLLGFQPIQSAHAATLIVTNTNDSGTGSLRQALAAAVSGDTITFDSSLSGQTIALATTLVINKNLTVDATALASPIIVSGVTQNNGTGNTRVFIISYGTNALLKGLTITKSSITGYVHSGGIDIYNDAVLTLENSTIVNNSAGNGGGILNWNGTLIMTNSTVSDNSAISGGGIYTVGGTTTLTNVVISGNASASIAGGIYNGSSLTVTDSTISNNSAGVSGGGGIYNDSYLSLINSIVHANSSTQGGGIHNNIYATMMIVNSTISENLGLGGGGIVNSGTATITGSTFRENSAEYGGGVNNTSTLTITNSTFSNNHASASGYGNGGAINSFGTPLTITNSTLYGNTAALGGGLADSGNPTITNSIVWGNSNGGLAIGSSSSVTYSIVQGGYPGVGNLDVDPLLGPLQDNGGSTQTMAPGSGSPAINAGDNGNCPATDQRGVSRPRGAYCDIGAYEVVIHHVKKNANGANNGSSWGNAFKDLQPAFLAASSGDQIWVAAGIYKPTTGTDRTKSFVLKNGVEIYGGFAGTETILTQRDVNANVTTLSGDLGVQGNPADNSYHVVTGSGIDETALLDGFTITAGNANAMTLPSDRGGGMYNDNSSPTLTNVKFQANSAGSGGGMFNEHSNPSLTNITFTSNTAANGGGLYNSVSSPTITDSTFADNSVSVVGGGMYIASGNTTLKNSTLTNNIADEGGGLINKGDLDILNSVFSGNRATAGGAIVNVGTLDISDSILSNNEATSASAYGGGVSNFGVLNITNSTFSGNTSLGGNGGAILNSDTLTVVKSAFSGNIASLGGGIDNNNGTANIISSTFSGNSAEHGGGTINFATLSITGSTFAANAGTSAGGGIENNAALTVINSTFSENSSGGGFIAGKGGGIYNQFGKTMAITNSTFSGNVVLNGGGGGAIQNDGKLNFSNTILANSVANSGASATDCSGFGTIGVNSHNLIELGVDCGTPFLRTDPMLDVLADNGGPTQTIKLLKGSPAIDAGSDATCPGTDQRGMARPQGIHCDMGAYETDDNVFVSVGGTFVDSYHTVKNQNKSASYTGINNGPLKIQTTDGTRLVASERVAYSPDGGTTWASYSELMGMPVNQLSTSYTFPWYNNADLNTQLRFGNVGNALTNVTVTVGGQIKGTYSLLPNQSRRVSYPGLNAGPVKVTSSGNVPIIASERVAYLNGSTWTSFSEMMGLPSSKLTTAYTFPWYNNADLNSQLRFGNVGIANTTVTVIVGGVSRGTYNLAPSQSTRVSYPGLNAGPVKVISSGGVPIIASLRVAFTPDNVTWPEFSEVMGMPTSSLSTSYSFPVYNNVDFNTQLRFGNVGTMNTTVTVIIGGVLKGTYNLAPNQSQRASFNNLHDGPVVIQSSGNVPIIASERVAYFDPSFSRWTSFSEMMGLPKEQLTTSYIFPWYNNVDLDTQLRFGVP